MPRLTHILALALALVAGRSTFAAVVASGGSGSSITTSYNGSRDDGFLIVEDVIFSDAAGVWKKELVNVGGPGNMLPSGQSALIDETFTNIGLDAWTGWHEEVLSTTDVGGGGPNYPGFLFRDDSLSVYRNGSLLTEGSDYTLTTEVYTGQVSPDGDWRAMTIFLSPGLEIESGDVLRITKDIFEVFGNGKIWQQEEAAVLGQYPLAVPEPASAALALIGGCCVVLSQLRRRRAAVWRSSQLAA